MLLEITNVHDLVNDDNVIVNLYRGLDQLPLSSDGKSYLPGGSQRVDERWGRRYIRRLKGKIVNGVLTTEPIGMLMPYEVSSQHSVPDLYLKDARLRLKLTPTGADGLLGAYVDTNDLQRVWAESVSSHIASYSHLYLGSVARAVRQMADAYPDPETGKNTAISSALQVKFVQAYVVHSPSGASSH